ncbi:MAG: peptide chain release factor N(5)-glutamine methyltransferase, partial [Ruminococcus sp.]|nr:peptide chain release factor N(5)-glutamine methyltransferase [Ruminococcus sp.]
MSSYAALLEKAVREFEQGGVEDAAHNARELLGRALGCDCRGFEFKNLLENEAQSGVQAEFERL